MTSLLQHRARFLVVFAMMATIGLSSCADTVTGTNDPNSEASIEASTHLQASEGLRTIPTPGERVVGGSTTTETPIQANPLLGADTSDVEVDGEGRTRNGLKIIDRF